MSDLYYHIVFCVNAKFFEHLPLAIYSICRHTTKSIEFHIFYSSLSEHSQTEILEIFKKYDKNRFKVVYEYLDTESELKLNGACNIKPWFGSYDAYTRGIVSKKLFDKGIRSIVYLDADILAVSSLDDLLNKTLTVKGLAGRITEPPGKSFLENKTKEYVQSGILVMNLDYLVKINFTEKFIKLLRDIPSEQLTYPDQDAINLLVPQKYVEDLGETYNFNASAYNKNSFAVVLHFTGKKPWLFWRKWNYAKYYYYREMCSMYLARRNILVSDKLLSQIFKFIEIVTLPCVGILNSIHDLNSMRKKARKKNKV